jgi:hypothetical protein
MTCPDLDTWLVELESCPASAVEQPLLQKIHQQDPLFSTALSLRQRWKLLFGLYITLLDYTSARFSPLGLEAEYLRLPVRQLTIPLVQLMNALVIAEFELDQVTWTEELDLQLSEQEEAACDQVLTTPESTGLLHELLSRGLAFLASCDLSEEGKAQ